MRIFPRNTILAAALMLLAGQTARADRQDISSKSGVAWEFRAEGTSDWKPITVPGGGWRAQGWSCDAGEYRAAVPIPASAAGATIRIAFDAVNFGAVVFAGRDEKSLDAVAAHVNGWMPFSADVTRKAVPGAPLHLRVEVQGRRKFMVNGKYTVPEGATWYPGLAEGILRGVSLEAVPKVRIERIFVRTEVAPDTISAQAVLVNDSAVPAAITVASPGMPTLQPVDAIVPANGVKTVEFAKAPWTGGPASYWWPNVPYRRGYRARMQRLDLVLAGGRKILDRRSQAFGFRQFRARGDHYELNGVRCNLRGDNQQEADFGTDAYGVLPGFGRPSPGNGGWPEAVDNLQRLNFNVMRIHQIPATPYMLDVCDEKGLMIVDESPLRGSEGGEDWEAGREHMIEMDREMALRDRNHPAVVIYSAANEWAAPIRECSSAMRQIDDTRPIIADGVGDMGPDVINMSHYVNGGGLPTTGGPPRADRPYGETESVWPNDYTMQGFAWMATGTRLRRLRGNSDIRNYVLNNAWPNYVPGTTPEKEVLEIAVKGMTPGARIHEAIQHPWNDPHIQLMQQCYHPLAAVDEEFERANAISNGTGDWPVAMPHLPASTRVRRRIVVFNDEFAGSRITVRWTVSTGGASAKQSGELRLDIPPGGLGAGVMEFATPAAGGTLGLRLETMKDGRLRFMEDRMRFTVRDAAAPLVSDGDYTIVNVQSGLALTMEPDGRIAQERLDGPGARVWRIRNLPGGEVTIRARSGAWLVAGAGNENGAAVAARPAADQQDRWRPEESGGFLVLRCVRTGRVLDVLHQSHSPGGEIVQWDANGGTNQAWELRPAGAAPR